jgi:predicted nucleic acid-binding protein
MIIDTGPLILLLTERRDSRYETCLSVFEALRGKFVTTYPCLTEAMHLLGDWHNRYELWNWILDGSLLTYDLTATDLKLMAVLMQKYEDMPMDFADASLVALAESTNSTQIFTLDRDFEVYRFQDKTAFEIIP